MKSNPLAPYVVEVLVPNERYSTDLAVHVACASALQAREVIEHAQKAHRVHGTRIDLWKDGRLAGIWRYGATRPGQRPAWAGWANVSWERYDYKDARRRR